MAVDLPLGFDLDQLLGSIKIEAHNGSGGPNDTLHLNNSMINDLFLRTFENPSDNNQYKRDLITYYLMGIGGNIVCVLGLIGNILSLLVLTRKTMRLSTNSYLAALSVCDSLVLIFTMILLTKDVNEPVRGENRWQMDEGIYPHIFPYIHPLAFTFQVTSIWLTLSFTVDRYIMICHPFKAEPFCTISRARKVILILYVSAVIFNIPKFFEYETVEIPLPMQNSTKIGYDLTAFGRSHVFREMYHSWFYIAFVCGIPFLSLAVLNAFLMHAVRLSRRRGREINAADKKRNDTTIMLIGVVVVFFICQMPALVSRTIWAFEHDPKAFKRLPLYTLNEIGNFLIILNSAINILPYYFFGRKFRKEFWRLFCQCLLRYSKFQKISRSYSLTVLDASRRPSQHSPHNSVCDMHKLSSHATTPNHSSSHHYHDNHTTVNGGSRSLLVGPATSTHNALLPSSTHHAVVDRKLSSDSCGQHSTSSWMTDDSYQRRNTDVIVGEVNGNCPVSDPGPHKCLLYDRIKIDPVSYGDEEL